MITINDIAKKAGVSQGTVSNVLNGRANVSSEKILLVQEACQALGYIPNERARILRRGHGKLLGVVLSELNKRSERDFFLSFKAYAQAHGYTVRLYLPSTKGGEAENTALRMAQSDMISGLAIFSHCMQLAQENHIVDNILYVERRVRGFAYLGFDYKKAGKDMATCILNKGYKSVTLVAGSKRYSNELEFCNSFYNTLKDSPCKLTIMHTDVAHISLNIFQLADQNIDEAFVCTQLELAKAVKYTIQTFLMHAMPSIFTLSPMITLPAFEFSKYELNFRLLGNTAAKKLIHCIENQEELTDEILENYGFRSWSPNIKKTSKRPINALTLDSPTAHTMRHMARLYSRQTGTDVNITICSYDEIFNIFSNIQDNSKFDVIRIDVTWLSWFAHKLLIPLEQIDPNITSTLDRFLDGTPEIYSYVNNTLYALPGSPSSQILFYRKDIFDAAINKRLYQEKYKTDLRIPRTFDEFNHIASFFTKDINPLSPVKYGATMTLGSRSVAGSAYLARLFALQSNLYDENGKVQLNSAVGLRALEQLLELKNYSGSNQCRWWTDTASEFASGKYAMSIIYNNFAMPLVDRHSNVLDNIGYAMIPGNRPIIGGGSLGVSRYSTQPQEALQFIYWLTSEPISSANALLGGISPCKKSAENYEIINNYPWLKVVNNCFKEKCGNRRVPGDNRPFDERRFLTLIGTAVQNAFNGLQTPQQALNDAQKAYEKYFD